MSWSYTPSFKLIIPLVLMPAVPLKRKRESYSAICPRSFESIFIILLIEHILQSSIEPNGEFFIFQSESIPGGQISASISLKSKEVRVEGRIAEYRGQVR